MNRRLLHPLLLWLLCYGIVLGGMSCGIRHGQASGLHLASAGGLYCSALGHQGPALALDPARDVRVPDQSSPDCPLGATLQLLPLLLLGLWWLQHRPAGHGPAGPQTFLPSPRQHWPPGNPQAP